MFTVILTDRWTGKEIKRISCEDYNEAYRRQHIEMQRHCLQWVKFEIRSA